MTTPIKNAVIRNIAEQTAAGPHTGDVVWWSFEDVEVNAAQFRAAWIAAGLPADVLPNEPSPARVLKRAAAGALVAKEESANEETLFRFVNRHEGTAVFSLVREAHGAEANAYSQMAKLAVNEETGQFLTDAPADATVQAIKANYDRMTGHYLAGELRSAVVWAVKHFGAVLIRDSGGVYWVPAKHAAEVRAIAKIISEAGHSTFDILPVHNSIEGNKTLAAAAQNSLQKQLTDLTAEMDAWTKGAAVRKGTLDARLAEYTEIRDRAALYAEILSAKVDDVMVRLDALKVEAEKMLDAKLADDKPAEKPTEKAAEAPVEAPQVAAQ